MLLVFNCFIFYVQWHWVSWSSQISWWGLTELLFFVWPSLRRYTELVLSEFSMFTCHCSIVYLISLPNLSVPRVSVHLLYLLYWDVVHLFIIYYLRDYILICVYVPSHRCRPLTTLTIHSWNHHYSLNCTCPIMFKEKINKWDELIGNCCCLLPLSCSYCQVYTSHSPNSRTSLWNCE